MATWPCTSLLEVEVTNVCISLILVWANNNYSICDWMMKKMSLFTHLLRKVNWDSMPDWLLDLACGSWLRYLSHFNNMVQTCRLCPVKFGCDPDMVDGFKAKWPTNTRTCNTDDLHLLCSEARSRARDADVIGQTPPVWTDKGWTRVTFCSFYLTIYLILLLKQLDTWIPYWIYYQSIYIVLFELIWL